MKMGYYTRIEGKIYYGDVIKPKQEVVERVIDIIENLQWDCSSSYGNGLEINYYTPETEWIHFVHVDIDKSTKMITFSGEHKNYEDATETLLMYIAPYLNADITYRITLQGEDQEYSTLVSVVGGKVFFGEDEFETDNTLSFPFPRILKK